MKAIVNVHKDSAYAAYNGQTFEVKEVLSKAVALNIYGQTVDFGYSEVFIVDINEEIQKAYDNYNWGYDKKTYICLINNLDAMGLIYLKPIYYCPL